MKSLKLILFICIICFKVTSQNGDDGMRSALLTYAGLPVAADSINVKVLTNTSYMVGYSETLKNPLWVVYRAGNMRGTYKCQNDDKWERPFRFKTDPRSTAAVSHDDYSSSGYDRGHMAPDALIQCHYGPTEKMETYLMTNISPQRPNLNQGVWENLEQYVRETLSQRDESNKNIVEVFITVGPIFDSANPNRLPSGIAIPDRFYKILTYQIGYFGTVKAVAFIFPQNSTSTNILDFVTTIDEIESATGLDFNTQLTATKQHNLESVKRDFDFNTLN